MTGVLYLSQPFAQHALIAGALVAVTCGLIGPFVVTRGMAFAVHGTSELAFTGAAAGLLVDNNPIGGALIGALVVAAVIGALGVRERERDSAIGVILAFGLGIGVLLLGYYHGFATAATNILFGNIFGVSNDQLLALVAIGVGVVVVMAVVYRPLLFASVDADVATARRSGPPARSRLPARPRAHGHGGGSGRRHAARAQPRDHAAAAAQRWSPNPLTVTGLSIVFALIAADGGILASLASTTVKPSVFVTSISFGIYLVSRLLGPLVSRRRRRPVADMVASA